VTKILQFLQIAKFAKKQIISQKLVFFDL